jgi:plastocyanin
VQVGILTQTSPGPLELLEYLPPDITIKPGDTILWKSETPHSVTFGSSGEDLPPGHPTDIPAAKPSDMYDGASFYHSGVFNLGPPGQAPTSFELTFPDAGTFSYICVLHWNVGHVGTVSVQQ